MNFIDNGPEKGSETAFTFTDFEFDPAVEIAPVIYADQPHRTTRQGVVVSEAATVELREFLDAYTAQLEVNWEPYYRLDVYLAQDELNASNYLDILEINTAFVDGWGTALNLSRAAQIPVKLDPDTFPGRFGLEYGEDEAYLYYKYLESERYRPELDLLVKELQARNIEAKIDDNWKEADTIDDPTYIYGRPDNESGLVLPQAGLRLDSKQNLANFSGTWEGRLVKTPLTFSQQQGNEWADVHGGVFLKFVDKSSAACARAGWSVMWGKPPGKSPFLRRSYQAGELLAQEAVRPFKQELPDANGGYAPDTQFNVQLVILSKGDVLTGYVQYARPNQVIINDNSIHGPLKFEGQEEN